MNIKWNIDTGYVTRIPDFQVEMAECELDDWAWDLSNGATEDDIMEQIEDFISEDLQQKLVPFMTNRDEFMAELKRRAEKLEEEEEE